MRHFSTLRLLVAGLLFWSGNSAFVHSQTLDPTFQATVLKTPFAEHPAHEALAAKRPDWARDKPGSATLSCSS